MKAKETIDQEYAMSRIIDEEGNYTFTGDLTIAEKLRGLIRFAILSPSALNTQPWKFKIEKEHVEITADWDRTLEIGDPECRDVAISLGAVASRLALAMRCFGMASQITYNDHHGRFDLKIMVSCVGLGNASPTDRMLMSQIDQRRDARLEDDKAPICLSELSELEWLAGERGCRLQWVEHGQLRMEMADLLKNSDRRRFADKDYREELARCLHSSGSKENEGISTSALGLTQVPEIFAPWLIRHVNFGKAAGQMDVDKTSTAPALGVLVTNQDGVHDWIDAGQALSGILLWSCLYGLACEVIDTPTIWKQLRSRMGTDLYPQAVLRFAFAPPRDPLRRRPVESFIQ